MDDMTQHEGKNYYICADYAAASVESSGFLRLNKSVVIYAFFWQCFKCATQFPQFSLSFIEKKRKEAFSYLLMNDKNGENMSTYFHRV